MNIRDSRLIDQGEDFHARVLEGVSAIANVTKVTLGPKGRNVLIEKKYGVPDVTKDGVSVAREIFLDDSVANMAAQLVKQAAVKTNEGSGDGTTTAIVLTQAIYEAGREAIKADNSPVVVKNYFENGVANVLEALEKSARPVEGEELRHVARIAANSKETGDLVFDILGDDPSRVVQVEDSSLPEHDINKVDGLRIENGYITPYMTTNDEGSECDFSDCSVLVVDGKIEDIGQLVPVMELLVSNNVTNLLLVADEVAPEVVQILCINFMSGPIKTLAVKSPGWGKPKSESLKDIAALTGAVVYGSEEGADMFKPSLEQLGTAKRVLSKEFETIITGGGGDEEAVAGRLADVQRRFDESDSQFDKDIYAQRLARLKGGVTILKVGGKTESEMQETLDRIEDAIQAVVAASEEGVLPGGGNALAVAAQTCAGESNDSITQHVYNALEAPREQIFANAGLEPAESIRWNKGLNVATGEASEDLMADGVIDPAKVTRTALENASSVACLLLMGSAGVTFIGKGDKLTEADGQLAE